MLYDATLIASATGTVRSSDNWGNNVRWQTGTESNYLRQGAGSTDRYMGCIWFDMSSLQSGTKTVKSATLTLTRNASTGATAARPVTIYSTTADKGNNGVNPYSGFANETQLGSMLKGETIAISDGGIIDIAQAIVNGTANAIAIYIGDTPTGQNDKFSTNWARFDGYGETTPPALTITYTVTA